MEDAINADANAIIIATMHKAKGKEFDHVYLLLEDYVFNDAESKRVLYVGCSRAKKTLQIHCNATFFDSFETNKLVVSNFKGTTSQPQYFEMILGYKDIYLASQKYGTTAAAAIKRLISGEFLKKDSGQFTNNAALGLANSNTRNILIFSKAFMEFKYNKFLKDGYKLSSGNVEYLLYWYDAAEAKEYKVVLPKLRFEKVLEL